MINFGNLIPPLKGFHIQKDMFWNKEGVELVVKGKHQRLSLTYRFYPQDILIGNTG